MKRLAEPVSLPSGPSASSPRPARRRQAAATTQGRLPPVPRHSLSPGAPLPDAPHLELCDMLVVTKPSQMRSWGVLGREAVTSHSDGQHSPHAASLLQQQNSEIRFCGPAGISCPRECPFRFSFTCQTYTRCGSTVKHCRLHPRQWGAEDVERKWGRWRDLEHVQHDLYARRPVPGSVRGNQSTQVPCRSC